MQYWQVGLKNIRTKFFHDSGFGRRDVHFHLMGSIRQGKNKPNIYVALDSSEALMPEESHLRVSVNFVC